MLRRISLLALLLLPLKPAPARAEQLGSDGRGSFAPLSLERAYALALRNSPALRVLRERVAQAEVARARAWTALKPTASFQASFTHFDQEIVFDYASAFGSLGSLLPPGTKLPEPTVIQKQNQFAFAGVANVPLFRGPAYPRIGIARRAVEVARLHEIRSRQDFLLRVAQAYYLVVTRADAVKALESKVAVDQKHLASARAQAEVGQGTRATVLRADLVLTQDQQSLLAQRLALAASRRQLAILLGVPGSVNAVRPVEPAAPGGRERAQLADALAGRADIRAAQVSLIVARKTREAIWWSFLPALDLSWMYRWSEAAGFAAERGSWNLMFTLNVPLYDGGQRYAELRDARSRVLEAQSQCEALGREIEAEIVRLRAELQSAEAGVVSARKAVGLARATMDDMQASFEVGAATQLDVLDAAQRRLEADLALTSGLFQRDLARLALAHAQGRFDPARGGGAP
jgi:outer membrane protein